VQYGHALKESGALRDPDMLAQAETAYRRALSVDPGCCRRAPAARSCSEAPGKTEEAAASYLRAFGVLDPSMPYPLQN